TSNKINASVGHFREHRKKWDTLRCSPVRVLYLILIARAALAPCRLTDVALLLACSAQLLSLSANRTSPSIRAWWPRSRRRAPGPPSAPHAQSNGSTPLRRNAPGTNSQSRQR